MPYAFTSFSMLFPANANAIKSFGPKNGKKVDLINAMSHIGAGKGWSSYSSGWFPFRLLDVIFSHWWLMVWCVFLWNNVLDKNNFVVVERRKWFSILMFLSKNNYILETFFYNSTESSLSSFVWSASFRTQIEIVVCVVLCCFLPTTHHIIISLSTKVLWC